MGSVLVVPGIELVEIQSQPTAGIEFTLSGIEFYPDELYCNIASHIVINISGME